MANAPQHALAKWLNEVLQPVVNQFSEHTIRDSFEFCSNIDRFAAEHDVSQVLMCSFDITSLFTNVPLSETIQICLDTLYREETVSPPPLPENLQKMSLMRDCNCHARVLLQVTLLSLLTS